MTYNNRVKTLYINRHAKSSWDLQYQRDFDRPLNKRGQRDAPHMAQVFADNSAEVDLIVSSPAERALVTARFFADSLDIPHDSILIDKRIYEASTKDLMAVINELDDQYNKVILFGHNPGFAYLVQFLTGEFVNMATCAIAGVNLHVDTWKAVSTDTGSLFVYDYPKNHFSS